MLVAEVPPNHQFGEEELLTMVRHRGFNTTRIIHTDEDVEVDWVVLSDDTFY